MNRLGELPIDREGNINGLNTARSKLPGLTQRNGSEIGKGVGSRSDCRIKNEDLVREGR